MKVALLVTALFLTFLARAQDVTGIWRGSFNSSEKVFDMFNIDNKYKCEVQIEQLDKALNGVTYSYKSTVFYGKALASGEVNLKAGEVKLRELKTVELKMATDGVACIMTYTMKYSKNGGDEFLEGTFESVNEKDLTDCGKGTVFLQKVATSDFHKEPFLVKRSIEQQQREMLALNNEKKPAAPSTKTAKTTLRKPGTKAPAVAKTIVPKPGAKGPAVAKNSSGPAVKKPAGNLVAKNAPVAKPPVKIPAGSQQVTKPAENQSVPSIARIDTMRSAMPEAKRTLPVVIPKVLASRENELVRTINITSREVVINIYDNGTIDHDTISVYLDKKLVVSKQMLTTNPITVKFTMDDDNTQHELIMVAENLGDIPPNTSLMVIKAGDQSFEVRISSTEQKNAVVAFRYKKPS